MVRGFDLNLLTVFDAIAAHENLTQAAKSLGVSQPAVSHALARLRLHFRDELFVRSGRGVVPTARAEELREPVRHALGQLAELAEPPGPFDPAAAQGVVRIATSDMVQLILLQPLLARLRERAPGIEVDVVPFGRDVFLAQLREGRVDLVLAGDALDVPGAKSELLYQDDFVCLLDPARIAVKQLTLALYLQHGHVVVSPTGRREPAGPIDRALRQLGRRRAIVVRVPHFMAGPAMIQGTDLILTTPRRLAAQLADRFGLRRCEPPFECASFGIVQHWHPRTHAAPLQSWVREQLREVSLALNPIA